MTLSGDIHETIRGHFPRIPQPIDRITPELDIDWRLRVVILANRSITPVQVRRAFFALDSQVPLVRIEDIRLPN